MKYETRSGTLTVETHCQPENLRQWRLEDGMGIFWRGDLAKQQAALVTIAGQPEGNVVVARTGNGTIVGFLTINASDPGERWGKDGIPGLLELGGIEVARKWRGYGVASKLLEATFGRGEYDGCIVIATAFSWHWDLVGMDMTLGAYRKMLHAVFSPFGFTTYATDDPNLRYDSGGALAARVGPKVSLELFRQFQDLLMEDQQRPDLLM